MLYKPRRRLALNGTTHEHCKHTFPYQLSPETSGYALVKGKFTQQEAMKCCAIHILTQNLAQ